MKKQMNRGSKDPSQNFRNAPRLEGDAKNRGIKPIKKPKKESK